LDRDEELRLFGISYQKQVLDLGIEYTDMDTGTRFGDTPICRFPQNTDTGISRHKTKIKAKKQATNIT
jgi:hypothetical protein